MNTIITATMLICPRCGREFKVYPSNAGMRTYCSMQCRTAATGELTAREIQVLDLAAKGWTNPRIGRHLHMADKTVKSHLGHIYTKLPAANRAQAVAIGLTRSLIRYEDVSLMVSGANVIVGS